MMSDTGNSHTVTNAMPMTSLIDHDQRIFQEKYEQYQILKGYQNYINKFESAELANNFMLLHQIGQFFFYDRYCQKNVCMKKRKYR